MKKALSLILAAVLLAGVMTGCGSGGGQSGGSASAAGTSSQTEAKQEWGFIFEQLTNPNYVTMSGVALDYCKELGIELQIVDGGENSDTIVNAAENMATMGYQVILLSPMAVEIAATAAEAAKAINPDIIVVNSAIQCDSCDYTLLQDGLYVGLYFRPIRGPICPGQRPERGAAAGLSARQSPHRPGRGLYQGDGGDGAGGGSRQCGYVELWPGRVHRGL